MKTSKRRIKRIKDQGYFNFSNYEITQLAFGNRLAYILCSCVLLTAVVTASIPLLISMFIIAFLGVVLPHHPFDYLYNHIIRFQIRKPKLPKRSKQLKFACTIASLFILITISLFESGYILSGYITGSFLTFSAILVSITDICIPSIIYNNIFLKTSKK